MPVVGVKEKGGGGSTIFVADGLADCDGGFLVGELQDHELCELFP